MDIVDVSDTAIAVIAETALQAGEAALIAEFPWLGLPFIKQIWQMLASRLASYAILELQKSSGILLIKMDNTAAAQAAKTSAEELKKVQDDPSKTTADREKARNDFKSRYADLIRYRTSRPLPLV